MLLLYLTRELCSFTCRGHIAAVGLLANSLIIHPIGNGIQKERSFVKCVSIVIATSDLLGSSLASCQTHKRSLLALQKCYARTTYKGKLSTNMKRTWRLWLGFAFCAECKAVGLTTLRKAAYVAFIRSGLKITRTKLESKKSASRLHVILFVRIAISPKRSVVSPILSITRRLVAFLTQ